MTDIRRWAPDGVAALFGISGIAHLVRPSLFESLIPKWLPDPRAIVTVSGVAELCCAIGLVARIRGSGRATALLLAIIVVGNVQMTVDAFGSGGGHSRLRTAFSIARLPLQIPLIWAALQSSRREERPGHRG